MAPEASAGAVGRPRPSLLIALGVAVVVFLASYLMPGKSAVPVPAASKPRVQAKKTPETVQPGDLDVHLGELRHPRPSAEESDRNPFKFYVKPPPPPPPPTASMGRGGRASGPVGPVAPPPDIGPPPLPPIPLKFIGVLETPSGKIAAFSDCRATMHGREGEIIDGRYRLVRIGVESVVMEYADGKGRTTIRLSGQECVGK